MAGKVVVAVATGTKCINGERLCLDGSVVNDCHAEVVARRCVLLWLYDQLLLALAGHLWMVVAGRLLLGLSMGLARHLCPAYIADISSPRHARLLAKVSTGGGNSLS